MPACFWELNNLDRIKKKDLRNEKGEFQKAKHTLNEVYSNFPACKKNKNKLLFCPFITDIK